MWYLIGLLICSAVMINEIFFPGSINQVFKNFINKFLHSKNNK